MQPPAAPASPRRAGGAWRDGRAARLASQAELVLKPLAARALVAQQRRARVGLALGAGRAAGPRSRRGRRALVPRVRLRARRAVHLHHLLRPGARFKGRVRVR